MLVGRILGWLLLGVAVVVLAGDLAVWLDTRIWRIAALGEVWANVHRPSLLLAEPAIDRHVWPGLWQGAIVPLLLLPAAPSIAVLGLLLVVLCRPRRRRRLGLRG